ncbi:MAG TPA: hypothetical protein VKQ32_02095 [Polyangia bacterium]|nr:hypothetical protein [Polyangia bacterium]
MNLPAVPPSVPDDEKRLALARVLDSRTFSRSDQLRAFLRYVCEAELEGRANQLNEYALGVSVLGRREGYSPAEDSSVRSRAYELRNKLRSYYQDEAPDDPIQIEIEKGAYVPRFQRRETIAEADRTPGAQAAPPATPEPTAQEIRLAERGIYRRRLLAIAALAVITVVVVVSLRSSPRPTPAASGLAPRAATREMEALWRPFLDGNVPMLMSYEIRLFLYAPATGLVIRDFQANQKEEVAKSKALTAFRERMNADQLVETYDYADVGAVQAAFLLGRLLNREVSLKSSSALGWEDIWNSNVIFIGKSNANPMIRRVLRDANLDFGESDFGAAVRNLHPQPGESAEYPNAATHGAGKKYGVVSVLPGPQPGHHMMILTGAGAELMWALAQSVTDPERVKEIMSHVLSPSGDAPAIFQVLIEATFESNVPIGIRYVTHHVYRAR